MAIENLIFDETMLAETLPTGMMNVGDDNHIANMANFSMYVNAKEAVNAPKETEKVVIPQSVLDRFGNWTGGQSTLDMAKDLKRRGLENADQLIDDTAKVNPSDPTSIRNSQSDWKIAAIQKMLSKARELNIRTPEAFDANIDVLTSGLNAQYRDALKNPAFAVTHPNFTGVVKSILKEQWVKDDLLKATVKK